MYDRRTDKWDTTNAHIFNSFFGNETQKVVEVRVNSSDFKNKIQAESEGLDQIFIEAGFDWRATGCSMCVGMNGDITPPGERCASTSNRNFRGRQGPGSRTHLMSPAMAAAAAVTGRITDVRELTTVDL